ncbi:MAG: phosphoribosyltransferase [Candidatus Methanomethylicaceae archaeon]|nr:phosphoribosyltransferase [Candidatus Verstraetearchaeota archaeon]
MKIITLNWRDIQFLTLNLAHKIIESNFIPDIIVGVARGGWVTARLLSDLLNVKNLASMKIEFYKSIGKRNGKPVITQPISESPYGKSVLIVDDVADTGESLLLAKNHVDSMGAKEIKLATLHMKPWSKIAPDFYVELTDAWIIYPWEFRESIEYLTEILKDEEKLLSIGIPKEYMEFLKKR